MNQVGPEAKNQIHDPEPESESELELEPVNGVQPLPRTHWQFVNVSDDQPKRALI